MNELRLIRIDLSSARQVEEYCASFAHNRERVTYSADRIPGLDHLEEYESVSDWLRFCQSMEGKISWYLSVREPDGKIVGALCLRHSLEYDDDDPEFASHIGYSIRPDERGKGYAVKQLKLGLNCARSVGLKSVRLVCLNTNKPSMRTILSAGGVYVDSLFGEESGLTINRYDVAAI